MQPLDSLYLFPAYRSRQDFRAATGKDAPAYNPLRPPKMWADPEAAKSPRRSVVYDNALTLGAQGQPLAGPDGRPLFEPLVLNRDEAATVNIWEPGLGIVAPSEPPVPPPFRDLKDNEELFFLFPGVVAVRDPNEKPEDPGGFTAEDRRVLLAIARRLDVD